MVAVSEASEHASTLSKPNMSLAKACGSGRYYLLCALMFAGIQRSTAFSTSVLALRTGLNGPSIKHPQPWSVIAQNRGKMRSGSISMQTEDYKKYGTEFDLLSGKDFDLLALRSFRREAILRYSNLNQSEPLRILIFGTLALLAASASAIADGVDVKLTTQDQLTSAAVAVGSFLLFLRERGRRTAQLVRMDRECAVGDLGLTFTDPLSGSRKAFSVRELRQKQRVLLVYGNKKFLQEKLTNAAVFRRRFVQSKVAFVAVSSDASTRGDWGLPKTAGGGWLWEGSRPDEWREYLNELLATKEKSIRELSAEGAWLALNMRGRSVASGLGAPRFDELLGTKLPPTDIVPDADGPTSSELDAQLLAAQGAFYKALTEGDVPAMTAVWADAEDPDVSDFLSLGGRLDPWDAQLRDGARPEGMTISSRDALLFDDGKEAWTTCLEKPSGGMGQTLLASQRWTLEADGTWKLRAHRTIPFYVNSGAAATLRCDKRGCVAGIRDADKAEKVPSPFVMPSP